MNSIEIGEQVNSVNRRVEETAQTKTNLNNPIKVLVSKQKRRFRLDGFNLDLTCNYYIVQNKYSDIIHLKKLNGLYANFEKKLSIC